MKNPTYSETMDLLQKERGFNKGVTLFEKNKDLIELIYKDFVTGKFSLKELSEKHKVHIHAVSRYISYKMSQNV